MATTTWSANAPFAPFVLAALISVGVSACAAGQSVTAGAAAVAGSHPCGRTGADSGRPDRVRPYTDSLAAGRAPGAVAGHVWDLGGEPQPYAAVALSPRDGPGPTLRVFADSLGAFLLTGAPPGYYVLEVARVPLLGQTQEVRVLPGLTDTICVALRSNPMDPPEIR